MEKIEQAAYFRRRAEEEHSAADHACDPRAAQSHRSLAARYEARATGSPVHDLGGMTEAGEPPSSVFTVLPQA